jgi:DNA-binding transcriptional LysR family regulator
MVGGMELRHLRYFVAVAEEENVTRAASRLRVAQPSLSRQIRDLEGILGISLFERGAKALRLTRSGKAFLEEARAVLLRADQALRMARTIADGGCSEIHVGYAPSLTVELLPRTLRLFQEACPDVRVRLHDLSTQEMLDRLRDESLHVALMIRSSAKAMAGIEFGILRRFAVCLAAHPAHSLARAERVGLEDIARERLVSYSKTEYPEYDSWMVGLFAKAGHSPLIAEEHDGATSLIASVESGRGVALVQQGFESLTGPRLCVRPLSPAPPPFVVGVACLKKQNSASVRRFIEAANAGS